MSFSTRIWEIFPELAKAVKEAHEDCGLTASGHDFDHDLRVAQFAVEIAEHDPIALMAGTAGLCHSADRIVTKRLGLGRGEVVADNVLMLLNEWLNLTTFPLSDREVIVDAVLKHGKANHPDDHPVKMALCDADRLANMDPDVIIRAGQFQPELMAVDPVHLENDPEANYRNPKSVLWDVNNCISWMSDEGPYVLRLPKARRLGRSRADFLQNFIDFTRVCREDLGLVPYPPQFTPLPEPVEKPEAMACP